MLATLCLSLPATGVAQDADTGSVPITLVATNDVHGRLAPVSAPHLGGDRGGLAYLATHLKRVRAAHPNTVMVDAGDLTGASIGLAHKFGDEPTVEAMNLLGLDVHTAGNHEFDRGLAALRRLRDGGCWQDDCGYRGGTRYPGATFTTLSSNIRDAATGDRVFPAWTMVEVEGLQIGFVGATATGELNDVARGELTFSPWWSEIEHRAAEARSAGADVVVLLRHHGATTYSSDINACPEDPALRDALVAQNDVVDVIIDAHTHSAYVCDLPGAPLMTQAHQYGTVFTEIHLEVDRATGDVVSRAAVNREVTHDVAPDPAMTALFRQYEQWWQALAAPTPAPSPTPTPTPSPTPSPTPTPSPSTSPAPTPTSSSPAPAPTATATPRTTPVVPGTSRRPVLTSRASGDDRIATAAQLANRFSTADTVLLARADHFADALVAGPLAAQAGAPLLLTSPDGLAPAAAEQLTRLRPGRVVLVGGEGALGPRVAAAVQALPWLDAGAVDRIAGTDRYDTAARIAGRIQPEGRREAFVTTGTNYPDALAGAALAARWRAPVLLTDPTTLPTPTRDALASIAPQELVVLGGTVAVSDHVADLAALAAGTSPRRLAGPDRYATAASVAAEFDGFTTAFVATGRDFPDALAGVAAAAHASAPVLLVEPDQLPAATASQLRRLTTDAADGQVVVVGGARAVSDQVAAAILRLY